MSRSSRMEDHRAYLISNTTRNSLVISPVISPTHLVPNSPLKIATVVLKETTNAPKEVVLDNTSNFKTNV